MVGKRKYFGTDGIRGEVGKYPITPEFIMKLGWAAGRVLAQSQGDQSKVLIGKDTRISGYMFESALEAGLSAAGVDIRLLGPMPTPGIAYLTRTLRADAGIVISASHNPYFDNGIKFFSAHGSKLADAVELEIEAELDKEMETVAPNLLGKAGRVIDAAGRYIEFCKSTISSRLSLNGLKIVVDCAHGATYDIAPKVFAELGAEVVTQGVSPNGLNINDACGSTKPQALQKSVLEHGADLGIALDGDGDRVILVDGRGEVVDGDEILYIVACASVDKPDAPKGVVGTLMSNLGLEHALAEKDIELHRAQVGDRYVMEMLQQLGLTLGGESSGHIICLEQTTTGDGIVSALQVLAVMAECGVSLNELKSGMTKYPQTMINVRTEQRFDFQSSQAVTDAQQEIEQQLKGRGRVLLRASGTEPVIRVMVEGQDAGEVSICARFLADKVEAAYQNSQG